jgi:hypothetical protein
MINYDDSFKVWIEILKLLASFLTPILILILGIIINKNVEKNKIALLKEKDWQNQWAETFLIRAIKFEENISVIITSLYRLQQENNQPNKNKEDSKLKEIKILEEINNSSANLQYLDWDIRNFVQFAIINKDEVIKNQTELIGKVANLIQNRQGDLEAVRVLQFEFNKAVRNAHSEILNKTI